MSDAQQQQHGDITIPHHHTPTMQSPADWVNIGLSTGRYRNAAKRLCDISDVSDTQQRLHKGASVSLLLLLPPPSHDAVTG